MNFSFKSWLEDAGEVFGNYSNTETGTALAYVGSKYKTGKKTDPTSLEKFPDPFGMKKKRKLINKKYKGV